MKIKKIELYIGPFGNSIRNAFHRFYKVLMDVLLNILLIKNNVNNNNHNNIKKI